MAPKQIFVNLAVADVSASTAFYTSIGAAQNPQFSDATTSCMVFDTIHVMIMTPTRFQNFLPPGRSIANAHSSTEVLLCLSADSKQEIDDIVAKAGKAGGKMDVSEMPKGEVMYGRSFEDLDGHVWELVFMDVEAMKKCGQEGEGGGGKVDG